MSADKRSVVTDALETLGTVIDENQKRDAIHIAVEPVKAGERLWPGAHVKVLDGVAFQAEPEKEALGIVDPFLTQPVQAGQRFWFLMYPRQVRSLRHVWAHPAFPDEPQISQPTPEKVDTEQKKRESEKWLRKFCEESDCPSYEVVIRAASGQEIPTVDEETYGASAYRNDGESLLFLGRDAHSSIPPEFWDHVEVVTGIKIPASRRAAYFSCSC